jgi:hypothetical protein
MSIFQSNQSSHVQIVVSLSAPASAATGLNRAIDAAEAEGARGAEAKAG